MSLSASDWWIFASDGGNKKCEDTSDWKRQLYCTGSHFWLLGLHSSLMVEAVLTVGITTLPHEVSTVNLSLSVRSIYDFQVTSIRSKD